MHKIGILHPGEMGAFLAVSARHSGHQPYWLSEGRSQKTRARAEQHGLVETHRLEELCETCQIIISICPPHAAEDVARSVIEAGFQGHYLDANAISPQRAVKLGGWMESHGVGFVDGGIIGGPAWAPAATWLYLSGAWASTIQACFAAGPLETKIIGNEIGKASALKMCYAAYTKGTTALLCAILATAEGLGVRDDLYAQWNRDEHGFSEQVDRRVRRVTAKAWRFEGEMQEIASTLREAGLPGGFHLAAAEIYHRMKALKDSMELPPLEEVLQTLSGSLDRHGSLPPDGEA